MITFLGRNELLNAFELLDDELGRMGVEADLFVVGGAAMAVAYDARRATTDVDAVFVPSKEVRTAASRVAEELVNAFEMLDEELGAMGVDADVFLVGGATMAVAFVRRHAVRC